MAATGSNIRNPVPADRRLPEVLADIQRRDRISSITAIGLILGSLPLLFIGPLILATLFWFVTWRLYGYFPWSWFFVGMVVVVIPSMLLGEAKQRSGFFAGANYDVSPGGLDGNPLSPAPLVALGEYGMLVNFATNPRLAASGFVEVFLLGPRLLMDGLTLRRRARQVRGASRHRAAQIVIQLAKYDQGIPTQSLAQPNERPNDMIQALCLLQFQDWIGISSKADKVWLLSSARNRLTPP